ncbi:MULTISPECIES: HAMP domain-containing protein [unclassified Streptomyces]|uniref:HAMP domain-containing protein n=1 Tax=unclassified Streptomyces TaxID=2593676 RepID=UPI002E3496DC|nr:MULTISPECIES: HAMP domain-containing protein [unclassified Streptomyces]WUC62901.1 HAMP domain-containing protein [Streptomyces sp. NBC_00539]
MSLLGGIRPPIAALSALLLTLAALTAFQLGHVGKGTVPPAVLTSQQHFAEDGAIALRASLDESVTDIGRTASLFSAGEPVSPDSVLDKLGNVYQKWRGTAVIEIKSGRLEAQRGENLPLTALDLTTLNAPNGLAPRMVRLENGETRLLTLALLSWQGRPQQLLVASNSLRVPGVSLGKGRAIAVLDASGQVLDSSGVADAGRERKQLDAFAKTTAQKAKQHPLQSKEPGSGGFPGVSGSLLGDAASGHRSVAGYAKLAGPAPGEGTDATALGLTVVSFVGVTEQGSAVGDSFFWLAAAGALLVLGAIAVALLVVTVQRPLLQLFLESRRIGRGDLNRPVTLPKYGEAARIGAALDRLRRQALGEPGASADGPRPGRRGRIGTRALIAVCALLLLAWSAPLLLTLNRAGTSVKVPQTIVDDQRERTDTLADRVRRALNEGHADLTSVASVLGAKTTPAEVTDLLERTRTQHARYASLYVLRSDGTVMARAGAAPHHLGGKGPSREPVTVIDSGHEPVITEYAEAPALGGAAVVGELRIDFINALLKRPGLGEVRVVDGKHRVVGGNSGYLAFARLPNDRLDALVTSANQKTGKGPGARAGVIRDGGTSIAAAAPLTGGGVAQPLGWTVVSLQQAKGLEIAPYTAQNRTVLAGLLGLTGAAACLGWLHIIVVRPLRSLAERAEALADGDRRTVLYPTHHDEVGAVTRSLEVIRQQLQEQRKRDAGGGAGRTGAAPAGRN